MSGRDRRLLALLLLNVGRPVGLDRLVDAFWDEPPMSARNQIQIAVHRLRRTLVGAGVPDRIELSPAGYVLHADAAEVDLYRFESLVSGAHMRKQAGDLTAERDHLREALSLWQGEAFTDVDSTVVAAAATRLDMRRLALWEDCFACELSLGRHGEVVDELAGVVTEHPTRERMRGLWMVALYRCGRQVEALEVFRDGRQLLADQMGIEPGTALTELHQRILRADPELAEAPTFASGHADRDGDQRYDTLPRAIVDFTGRRAEVDQVVSVLSDEGATPIVVIDGMAGAGKTALAVEVAHLLEQRAPDARLFIDLHGHSPASTPLDPAAALASLLRQVGVPGDRLPAGVDERAALWRSELAGRRALVVLDNAVDSDQVTPLLPGGARCVVLVTARRRLAGLDGMHGLSLDLLPAEDAEALFAAVVGAERVAAERGPAAEVVEWCARLPLAVRIAASRLTHRPMWTIRYLADRLADAHRRLGELAQGGRGVAAAFALSYDQLTTAQQRMFRLFGHHVGEELDAYLAAAALDMPLTDAEDLLETLVDAHLVTSPTAGRYRQHDLIHTYAKDLAAADPESVREETTIRILDYYIAAATRAADLLHPGRRGISKQLTHPPAAPPPLRDHAGGLSWLQTERPNLVAAVAAATAASHAVRAWWLTHELWPFLDWAGYFDDWETTHRGALAALGGQAYQDARASLHNRLGFLFRVTGRADQAIEEFRRSLTLARAVDDPHGVAWALTSLAMVYKDHGRYQEALTTQRECLTVEGGQTPEFRPIGLANLASLYNRMGRFDDAARCCEEAIAAEPSWHAAALAQQGLGFARMGLGDHERALYHLGRAEQLHRDAGNLAHLGSVLSDLGTVHARLERFAEALAYHRRALSDNRQHGTVRTQCHAFNDAGATLLAVGRAAEAAAHHREALALARRSGLRHDEAMAHDGVARAVADTEPEVAREHWQRAYEIFTDLGLPEADRVAARLGEDVAR